MEGEIQSVAYSDQYVAVISDQPNGEYDSRLDLYSSAGELIFGRDFTYPWQKMEIDRDFIILYNDRSCRIYSAAGKERFSGEFDFTVSMITRGRQPNSLIITGGLSEVETAVEEVVRFFRETLRFHTCEIHKN